jgi:hypothetical protein
MAEGTSCGRCHLTIARFAPQVVEEASLYHRECYEAWFFSRHGRRPALVAAPDGRRQRYRARDRAA